MSESDEKLRETLVRKFKDRGPTGPWEHDMMRKGLIEAISNPNYVDDKRLKWVYSMVLGTMIETLEVQQVQQLMISMDNQFDKLKKERAADKAENKSEHKWLRLGIAGLAVASGLLGIASEQVIGWVIQIAGL